MRKLKNEELERLTIEQFKKSDKSEIVIVLDNIRSLNNIGSLFRTSDAFLVKQIHLCGITAQPPHREIQKTALGATESVDWRYFENPVESVLLLKKGGYQIVAIEQIDKSIRLENFFPQQNQKYAFIFGNEINGVSEAILEYTDFCVEIPQFGTKHSFNVSVSAGIILWHVYMHSN
ncbi:MAG: RNA methyltransferase [Bacteroidales bacterium]